MTLLSETESRPARLITDGLEPKNWIGAVSLLIGWHADRFAGLGWGVFAAVFAGGIPTLWIKFGQRKGYWGDRHARRRQDRLILIPGVVVSVVLGMLLMAFLGAPGQMLALVAAMLCTLLAILAITTVWKISVHTAVSAGSVIMLALAYGPWPLVLFPLVAVIGWSRLALRDHTLAQVVAGTALGATVAGTVFGVFG